MKKFKVTTDCGFCGAEETEIIEAENQTQAEDVSWSRMIENLSCHVEEATEQDLEDYE